MVEKSHVLGDLVESNTRVIRSPYQILVLRRRLGIALHRPYLVLAAHRAGRVCGLLPESASDRYDWLRHVGPLYLASSNAASIHYWCWQSMLYLPVTDTAYHRTQSSKYGVISKQLWLASVM